MISLVVLAAIALPAPAHDGRRFQIEVRDNQLRAQGVNSAGVPIDPAGLRNYFNAIHGHWSNLTSPQLADLPGYDAGFGTTALSDFDVYLTITGATKWTSVSDNLVDPDASGSTQNIIAGGQIKPGTTLDLQPLAANESLQVNIGGAGGETVSTVDLGGGGAGLTITLIDNFDGKLLIGPDGIVDNPDTQNPSNGYDVDLTYLYDGPSAPLDAIYVLETVLSTDAPGIADSDTVYTIFAPDGSGPINRLHFAALFTEQQLGTVVPEPASAALLAVGGALVLTGRRHGRKRRCGRKRGHSCF